MFEHVAMIVGLAFVLYCPFRVLTMWVSGIYRVW